MVVVVVVVGDKSYDDDDDVGGWRWADTVDGTGGWEDGKHGRSIRDMDMHCSSCTATHCTILVIRSPEPKRAILVIGW